MSPMETVGFLFVIELFMNKKSRPYIISEIILIPFFSIGCAFVSEFANSINRFEIIFGIYLLFVVLVLLFLIGKAISVYNRDKKGLNNKSYIEKRFWYLPINKTIWLVVALLISFGFMWFILFCNYKSNNMEEGLFINLSILFTLIIIGLLFLCNNVYKTQLEKINKEKLSNNGKE